MIISIRIHDHLFDIEETNAGVAVFVAEVASMCGLRCDGAAPSFLSARLYDAAVISLSSPVYRICFRALPHFARLTAMPSQDIMSMSTSFISLTQSYLYRR